MVKSDFHDTQIAKHSLDQTPHFENFAGNRTHFCCEPWFHPSSRKGCSRVVFCPRMKYKRGATSQTEKNDIA